MSIIVGIDLGSHSVKVVRLEGKRGQPEVIGFDQQVVAAGPEDTRPLDERQLEALRLLQERDALAGQIFVSALQGGAASMRTLRFPFSDPKKIEESLPFELEAEIPFDIDDITFAFQIAGQRPSKDEDQAAETEVLVSWAKNDAVAEHLALLESVGIEPRRVLFDAFALIEIYEAVFKDFGDTFGDGESITDEFPTSTPGGTLIQSAPDAPTPAVAVVDIGHRQTTVCIMGPRGVVSARNILHGGMEVTRNLSREIGISLDDAERGKRTEAFIEVAGAEAQFPEQRRISEILKRSYNPIFRQLRQMFQSCLGNDRMRVSKIILVGGGSHVANLDRHMSSVLNIHAQRGHRELQQFLTPSSMSNEVQAEALSAAAAASYALAGHNGDASKAVMDMRSGVFAWRGELDFIRDKAAKLALWALVIFLTILFTAGVRYFVLGGQESKLVKQQRQACKEVINQDIDSTKRCISIIDEKISGSSGFTILEDSAADLYLELSRRLPSKDVLPRKVTSLDIDLDRIRVQGHTADYDGVEKIRVALQGGRCFREVEMGKSKKRQEKIEWNSVISVSCADKPEGTPLPKSASPKKAPSAMAARKPASRPTPSPVRRPAAEEETEPSPTSSAAEDRKARIEAARERARKRREERAARGDDDGRADLKGVPPSRRTPFDEGRPPAVLQEMKKRTQGLTPPVTDIPELPDSNLELSNPQEGEE